jgi:hypothetical protein
MNMIRDNPVTTKEVDVAEQLFGPDIGTIKAKKKAKAYPCVRSPYRDPGRDDITSQGRHFGN